MQMSKFFATVDLEIGDEVKVPDLTPAIYIIEDIRTIHSLKEGTVVFEFLVRSKFFEFPEPQFVKRDQIIYPMV